MSDNDDDCTCGVTNCNGDKPEDARIAELEEKHLIEMAGVASKYEDDLEQLEAALQDLQLKYSHTWADKQFAEAQCAALREALMSAAYYYEPATTVLNSTEAGAALLKRLQAAEAVCKAVAYHNSLSGPGDYVAAAQWYRAVLLPVLEAWRKEAGK